MSSPVNKKTERNNDIIRLREGGETFKALGDRFGICAQRVRQIVMAHNRMMRRPTQSEG